MEKIKKNIEFIVGLAGLFGIFYSIIVLMAILIYPIIMRNQDKKENHETKLTLIFYFGYMLIIGANISVLNVYFLDAILKNISINIFVNENGIITRIFVCFITYVGLMGVVFWDVINIIKKFKKIVLLFIIICISLDALLLIGSTGCVLSKSIKDKSNYEIMYVNNKKYVVLSEYDDKILAVPLRIGKDGYSYAAKPPVQSGLVLPQLSVFSFDHIITVV